MNKSIKKNVTIRSDEESIKRWRRLAESYKQSLNTWIVNILDAEADIEDNYERISIVMSHPGNNETAIDREHELQKVFIDAGFQMLAAANINGKRHLRFVKRKEQHE